MLRFLNNLLRGGFLRAGHPWSLPGTAGVSRGAGPKGTFKPQFEALERREVMSAATTGVLAAPPASVLAIAGSVLANPGITPQATGSVSDVWFKGDTAVEVVSTPAPPARPTRTTVQTLQLKDQLDTLFNQNLPSTTNAIIAYLSDPKHTAGHSLSNISLNLAYANWPDSLLLSVDSTHGSFTLTYTQTALPGSLWASSLSCKVNDGPDTSMTVQFNLQLVMNFTTSGSPGNGPVALQSATMRFANPNVCLSGFGVTTNDEVNAEVAFINAQGDATATLQNDLATPLAYLNSQLLSYAPQAVVTPFYDASNGLFDLIVSSGVPSTAPHASALAQSGGTVQNNQQTAFQADLAQPGKLQALDQGIQFNEFTIKKTSDKASPVFFKNA